MKKKINKWLIRNSLQPTFARTGRSQRLTNHRTPYLHHAVF